LSKKAEVVICFDYGTKKIGACIGETYTGACSPLKVIKNDSTLVEGIKNLVEEWNPNFILVGMPSKPSTEFEKGVLNFIETIKITFELKVLKANEDFTSAGIQANNKDARSATLIFEDWFNLNYG
jgi:putative Holliday junction resolvase